MTELLRIAFTPENGTLPEGVLHRLSAAVTGDKRLVLKLEVEKKRRSLNQNAYYFGVVVPAVTAMFGEHGNNVSEEGTHTFLKMHVGKMAQVVVMPDGTVKKTPRSTASLTTSEFLDYNAKIRAWAG